MKRDLTEIALVALAIVATVVMAIAVFGWLWSALGPWR